MDAARFSVRDAYGIALLELASGHQLAWNCLRVRSQSAKEGGSAKSFVKASRRWM